MKDISNVKQDHELEKCLDVNAIVRLCQPAIKNGKKISASLGISNTDRVCRYYSFKRNHKGLRC